MSLLFDYQLDAVNRLQNGSILCGGVGSGKSRTALGYYFQLNGGDLTGKNPWMTDPMDLYIITTARKRDDREWDGELIPFLLSRDPESTPYQNKVVIDSWNNIQKYRAVLNSFFIFDEQRVVGKGAWAKSFMKIAKKNQWILLSATPGDTWEDYVPIFLANGFFRTRTEFNEQHVIYSPFCRDFPKIEGYRNTGRLIRLREKILVDMDFDRKTNSHHEDVFAHYDALKYREIGKTRWNPYKDEPIATAAELCYTWRRLVNEDESRQVALLNIFEKHPKMIVFYNYNYELDILRNLYYGDDVEVAEWNGCKHQAVPTGKSWVYLVQYNAGAEGWNCITTDTIVFYSQNYSYKIMEQSSGRIDRLNTPFKDLYYYHIRSRSNIDNAIERALKEKKKFNETRYCRKFGPKEKSA